MIGRAHNRSPRELAVVKGTFGLLCGAALASLVSCAHPVMARDGTVVFQEPGAGGASVVTANGVEFHDSAEPPTRTISHDATEPWRAPIGFLLPKNGVFTQSSKPTTFSDRTKLGIAIDGTTTKNDEKIRITLRPSDTWVPSWGGEVLVRIDVAAPAEEGSARFGEDVVLVLGSGDAPAAGKDDEIALLVDVALGQLASRDRVTVLDAVHGRVLVPSIPASNRSLILAAVAQRNAVKPAAATGSPFAKVLATIHANPDQQVQTRALVFGNGHEGADAADVQKELVRLNDARIGVDVIASSGAAKGADAVDAKALGLVTREGGGNLIVDADIGSRAGSLRHVLPASGVTVYDDVVLTFEGTPAPSHVLEASGGDVRWRLEAGELDLGPLRSGEARTEIVRVTVPAWTPAERFKFTVTAHLDRDGAPTRDIDALLPCTYSDNLEVLSSSRNGDVIAYASALASRKRLDAAFLGVEVGGHADEGLKRLAILHAKSLKALAADTHDPALAEESDTLSALVSAASQ